MNSIFKKRSKPIRIEEDLNTYGLYDQSDIEDDDQRKVRYARERQERINYSDDSSVSEFDY